MKASVDKLRWGLAGGSLALLVVLVVYMGYGKYKTFKNFMRHPIKGGTLEQTTDGFTYSQSVQGRTVFTLHAAKAIQHGGGKYTLRDVILTLYGHGSDRADRISGAEFEYDEKQGIARALGDVEMDVRAPGALARHGDASSPTQDADRDIHVHTSGLVYVRKLGVAATDQPVDIRYAGIECTAKGAEFDSGESIVHLLADVQLHGNIRGKNVQLHASKADLNRESNIVLLVNPNVESGRQTMQAANATLHLRSDGSVETMQANGNVALQQGTRRVTAARMEASFNGSNIPQQTKLLDGVALDDSDAARGMHGVAREVDVAFDPAGAPLNISAIGKAEIHTQVPGAGGAALSRMLRGNRIDAVFARARGKKGSELSEVHVVGPAMATAEAPAPQNAGVKTTQIAADDLRAVFVPGGGKTPDLRSVTGEGHTRLQQDAPRGEQQISTGDKLELTFAAGNGANVQIASAAQTGHVQMQSRAATKANSTTAPEPVFASADRSTYDGANEKLVLVGSARFKQGDTVVTAASIAVDQRSGDADATGDVQATFSNEKQGAQASHVRAETAHLQHGTEIAQFHGSDAKPARLWQDASQIEAEELTLDGKRKTLAARPERAGGTVRAVFAGAKANDTKSPAKPSTLEHGPQVARVTAATMDYDDAGRAATFDGGVHVIDANGQVQSQHAVVFLSPAKGKGAPQQVKANATAVSPFGGSLERVVIWGDVHLEQPGRSGRGDRLVYTAADASFVLTGSAGHLPQVVDAQRGSVTGTALLFGSGDSTIIVSGSAPGESKGERGRVRIETGAKQ